MRASISRSYDCSAASRARRLLATRSSLVAAPASSLSREICPEHTPPGPSTNDEMKT